MPTKIKFDDVVGMQTDANVNDRLSNLYDGIDPETRIMNPDWTVTLGPNEEITLLSDIESSSRISSASRISTLVGTGFFSEDFSADFSEDLIDKKEIKKETKKLNKEEKIMKKLKKDIKELEENIKDSISDLEV